MSNIIAGEALLAEKKIPVREKREEAITAFYGTNQQLQKELARAERRQRIRTFSQDTADELIVALRLLSTVKNAVIIVHGILGSDFIMQLWAAQLNREVFWYSTNLDERDTILGSDEKLSKTVYQAWQEKQPDVVFIVATSVVAINNDDISSVIFELESELPLKIVAINTDGFKSRAKINGIDIVNHALGRHIIKESVSRNEQVAIVSIAETRKNLAEIERLAQAAGVAYRIVPQFAAVGEIAASAAAGRAIGINYDEADVFLTSLAVKGKTEIIETVMPIGIDRTCKWLRALTAENGNRQQTEAFIETETAIFAALQTEALSGKKVFINLPARQALAVARFLMTLGLSLAGIAVPHIDNLNKKELFGLPEELPIRVGDGQPFELVNILTRSKPDFYIGTAGLTVWTSSLGIIPIEVENLILYGFQGAAEIVEKLLAADKNQGFVEYLQKNTRLPYTDSWLQRSPDWHIKIEVK